MKRKALRQELTRFQKAASDEPKNLSTKEFLDFFFKIPLAIVSFLYVSGIIVRAFYFGNFEVESLNLFKLSYIVTGFWATLVLFLPAFLIAFICIVMFKPDVLRKHYHTAYPRVTDIISRAAVILISIGLVYTIAKDLFPFLINSYNDWLEILKFGVIFAFVIPVIVNSIRIVLEKFPDKSTKIYFSLAYCLFFIFVYLSFLYSFSTSIYLNIPAYLGGGKPTLVNVGFKIDKKEFSLFKERINISCQEILNPETDSEKSKDKKDDDAGCFVLGVYLVAETENGFYFKADSLSHGAVFFIPRDSVLHLSYIALPKGAGI